VNSSRTKAEKLQRCNDYVAITSNSYVNLAVGPLFST